MIPSYMFDQVKKYFDDDEKKARAWFSASHPNFGLLSPLNMIELGRFEYVKDFINKEMKI